MHYYIQISNHITGLKKKIQKSSNLSNIDFCLSFMSHMHFTLAVSVQAIIQFSLLSYLKLRHLYSLLTSSNQDTSFW